MTAHLSFDDERGWLLVDRYAAGECDPAETAAMVAWLARTPAAADLVGALKASRVVPDAEVADWDLPSVYARFPQQPSAPSRPVRRPSRWLVGSGIGAGVAAVALAIGLYSQYGQDTAPRETVTPRTYTAQRGQIANIALASGTRIQLAPLSRITIAGNEVTLDGEAVFEVAHQSATPFVVHSRNATTRVLGTRFGVRAYVEDSSVRVAVTDGKVAVNAVVLAAGDVARVGTSGTIDHVEHGAAVERLLEWTDGKLAFDDVPLSDAVVQLSRWYGFDIVLSDPALGRRLLTTTVKQTDPVDSVMRAIAISTGTSFERRGNTIVISKAKRAVRTTELVAPPSYATLPPLPSN